MTKIAQSLLELIGNTPLLNLARYQKAKKVNARLIAKLEYFNPVGSVKDRVGYALIQDAEEKGLIQKGSVIIEPTSGNTGIGLALAASIHGYRLILTMPETMSVERRKLLGAIGAEIVLTPGAERMAGAIKKAKELAHQIPNSFIPQQFINPANPEIHRQTTGPEIWADTDGLVDIFVAGVGTGGTITGVGEFLKGKNSQIKVVAVEPYSSPVLSGGEPGAHNIQGIGAGFVPEVLNREIIDEVVPIHDQDAFLVCRELAQLEGLLIGISGGAAVKAATIIAERPENQNKNIVVLLPDTGERYLSAGIYT